MAEERSRQRGATTRVREWIRDRVDPAERATTAAVTEATMEWLQAEPDLLDRFVYEQVFATCGDIIRAVMLNTRRHRRQKEAAEETPAQQRARLQQWFDQMEHVSPEKGYIRLGKWNRVDLNEGIAEERARLKRSATRLRWLTMLRDGLDDDETTVEERFTAAQVEACYRSASDEVSSRMDSILEGVAPALRAILYPNEGQGTQQPAGNGK
jgi:hypothetical protein